MLLDLPACWLPDVYGDGTPRPCYTKKQLIEYGEACAEAMRDACAAEITPPERLRRVCGKTYRISLTLAESIRALEVE